MARFPAQLRLISAQVAEQDLGLSLADVQTGEFPKTLSVVAPITDGDMDFELARIVADRLQGNFVDGEAEVVESTDGPLDAVAVGEAEDGFGVQQFPQRVVADRTCSASAINVSCKASGLPSRSARSTMPMATFSTAMSRSC